MLDHTQIESYLSYLAARQDLRDLLQLDRYTIGERLGEGGFSWVYKLVNQDTGRGDLAFKIVSADTCKPYNRTAFSSPKMLNTLRREQWLGQELVARPREHLVRFYAAEELVDAYNRPVFLYVMDCYKLSFHDFMEASYSFQEETALRLGIQICQALCALHTMDVIHRDVKAENIYIVPTEQWPKYILGDFGNCRFLDEENPGTNTRIVSPGISPEEQGSSAGLPEPSWDTYALGATLYSYCNDRKPLDRSTGYQPPRHGSTALHQILEKALARHPEDRYRSARQMLYDLSRLTRSQHAQETDSGIRNTKPLPQPSPDRKRETKPLPKKSENVPEKTASNAAAKKKRRRSGRRRRHTSLFKGWLWFLIPVILAAAISPLIGTPVYQHIAQYIGQQIHAIQEWFQSDPVEPDPDAMAGEIIPGCNLVYANTIAQFLPYGYTGYFAREDGLYQATIYRTGGVQQDRYTEQTTFTDWTQINEDFILGALNQSGDYLYYLGVENNGDHAIYRVDLDSKKRKVLFTQENGITGLLATTDALYFTVQEEGLYRMGLDGKDAELLLPGVRPPFLLLDNQLYYVSYDENSSPQELRQRNLTDGSEQVIYRSQIREDGSYQTVAPRRICSDGTALYFADFLQGVFRLANGALEQLPNIPAGVTRLWVMEDVLFYTISSDDGERLCQYDLEQMEVIHTQSLPNDLGGYLGIYPDIGTVILRTTNGWYQLDAEETAPQSLLPLQEEEANAQENHDGHQSMLDIRSVTYEGDSLSPGIQADLTLTIAYNCPENTNCLLRVGVSENSPQAYLTVGEQPVSGKGECTITVSALPTLYADGSPSQVYAGLLAEDGQQSGSTLTSQTYDLPVVQHTDGIAVPQVVGYTQSQAVQTLQASGLDFKVWWYEGDCEGEEEERVVYQSIPAGTRVQPGAIVKLQLQNQ